MGCKAEGLGWTQPLRSHWTPSVTATQRPSSSPPGGENFVEADLTIFLPMSPAWCGFQSLQTTVSQDCSWPLDRGSAYAGCPFTHLGAELTCLRFCGCSRRGSRVLMGPCLLPGSRSNPCSFCSGSSTASRCFAPWKSRACGHSWRAAPHSCRERACWPGGRPAPQSSMSLMEGLGRG